MTPKAMLRQGDQVKLRVDRLAYGGRGVARHNGLVVFVTGAAAGEVVRARVGRVRRSYAEAETAAVLAPSAERVQPRCPHFGPCGGCAWQHIAYPAQAAAKEAIVRESLVHLGGIADPAVQPIVAAADPWFYRNKMDFSFHPDGTLGLHRRGDWNRIEPVEVCYLQSERSAALVRAVRTWARERGPAPFDPRTHAGFLRSLVVREGRGTGERLVGLVTGPGPFVAAAEFVDVVRAAAPDVAAIVRGIVTGAGDGAPVTRVEVLSGRDHIEEAFAGLRFRIGLETFFQTNTPQAERMVAHVVDRAAPAGRLVYDLYCGVGTFALALARAGGRVAGVELAEASVAAARENAARNGLDGVRFTAGDVRTVLPVLAAGLGLPDVVVLDPPRAGAGGKVMRKIGRTGARRVIYVSCNPTTLAPDLKALLSFGYRLVDVQPFDLFPQTYHVEAIAVLDREPAEVNR
ncbi:MAG: 23S rRNA (uracil(1939)-C(5))-methyltransferase RlmD [Armatimonadota bacterium]|nr:23S rRNA (uracil(1939)-C(5))-methyltransferase RlmD [Armatimonadota bacterium]MDR7456963.1 23S rRNA (uracil(1939)-C(5))-methyltransferase RlmD [Armatimonadota bacterium]MDR7496486.1 23S rRNA (uracil(1939)-C(5))-methyltransferase RlmD [Armatimonadota bacterium]MDR7511579.1 23S rRNA (uracil(1939)-C(5))-methyltransferase RlmD [Armatimonadota bacterium]